MDALKSNREKKIEALWEEAKFYIDDADNGYDFVKIVARELPWKLLMRIINKCRRLRGLGNLWTHP